MSIQESLNQMLYSASIASGLYAQSPAGRAGAATRRGAEYEEKASIAKTPEVEKTALKGAKREYKTAFRADPTEQKYENLQRVSNVLGTKFSTKEGKALKSLIDRATPLQEQKEFFAQRQIEIKNYKVGRGMEVLEYGNQ